MRTNRYRRWAATGALFGLALLVAGCAAGAKGLERRTGPEYASEVQSWQEAVEAHGRSGYWLVVRGYHPGDDVIAMGTNSELSHAVILDAERKYVIEAVEKGVVEKPLAELISESHRVQVIRPQGWTAELGLKAVERARSVLGSSYDWTGIVGAPSKKRYYCSELAAWSMSMKVDSPGPQHVIHPKNLYRLGQVLFDTGDRDQAPDTWPVAAAPADP